MEEERGDSQAAQGTDLGSKLVTIELKRFYVDLKKNDRGVFVKIAEVDASGSKSKIILPFIGIEQFKCRLTLMHAASAEMDAAGVEPPAEVHSDPLRTEMMRCEDKRFFFDLCANVRGRFLKISQVRASPIHASHSCAELMPLSLPVPGSIQGLFSISPSTRGKGIQSLFALANPPATTRFLSSQS